MGQKLPQDLVSKVVKFIMTSRKLRHQKQYPVSFIGSIWMRHLARHAWRKHHYQNWREVSSYSHHNKGQFTVILAAMADGRKLKPFVVFKGVRAVPELTNTREVVVAMSQSGWMNEELTKDWVK